MNIDAPSIENKCSYDRLNSYSFCKPYTSYSTEEYLNLDKYNKSLKEEKNCGWKIKHKPIDSLEIERTLYEIQKEKYLKGYEGKYIAISQGRVLFSANDFSELAKEVYESVGYKEVFMTLVTEQHKPHRFSPKFKKVS